MAVPVGSDVVVRTLRSKRGIVVDVSRDGRYRVRVEGVTIWCREEDLAAPPETKKKKRPGRERQPPAAARSADEAVPPRRVDLHGLRVEEAIARTVDEIDRALLAGADRVEVVHGKGGGRLRDALHRHLASMPVVKAFKLDPANPGVTWVYF